MTTGLSDLLSELQPELQPGRFVFVALPESGTGDVEVFATVREPEGVSAVLAEADANHLGLEYDFVAAWITLRVDSSAADVGLTAAFSTCLTGEGISCNVIAGLHHDHLLVPVDRADEAMAALEALAASARG
jgi:hypothetical protein